MSLNKLINFGNLNNLINLDSSYNSDNSDNSDRINSSNNSDRIDNSDKIDSSDISDSSDNSDKIDSSDNSDRIDRIDSSDISDSSDSINISNKLTRVRILNRIRANDPTLLDTNLYITIFTVDTDLYIKEIISGLYNNTNLECLEFGHFHLSHESIDSIIKILQFNTNIINISACDCFNSDNRLILLLNANRRINKVLRDTPPLNDGNTDAGDFDALPNELLCEITIQLWNIMPETAFAFAHTCKRARDCVYSDWTAQKYLGADHRYNMRHLFRALA